MGILQHICSRCGGEMKGLWFITPHTIDCKTLTSLFAPSSETQGQIVGTRESLNGQRKNTRALDFSSPIFFVARLEFPRPHYMSAPESPRMFFLSFFCCSVLEISMRDEEMCDARIKGSHTRRDSLQSHS